MKKMKKVYVIIGTLMLLVLSSCSSTQSLQEYYVDNSENPNFISFDVSTSILNLDKADLSATQKEAFEALNKLNILAFKKTNENIVEYKAEKTKINAILKNEKYTQLMKMNTSYGKATIKYLGDEDAIDEVIIYGDSKDKGFALIRVLGDNMNPIHMTQLLQALQKSDYKGEGLDKLADFFKE